MNRTSNIETRFYINGFELYRKERNGMVETERESLHILNLKQPEELQKEENNNNLNPKTDFNSIFDTNQRFVLIETLIVDNGSAANITTVRYQYGNHLGSACLELDETGRIISYEEYHPFGTTSYRSGRSEIEVSLKRYKYVGKERDNETGLYYYGARYYAAWLCRFVSVDPLQFEYPELTPYQYASNRPVTGIDLDGREVYMIGNSSAVKTAYNKLSETYSNLKLTINSEGKLGFDGEIKTKDEQMLVNAINSDKVKVKLEISKGNSSRKGALSSGGGAFLGNTFDDAEKTSVTTEQFVSLDRLGQFFESEDIGQLIAHEITESYQGGLISLATGVTASSAQKGEENAIYDQAHNRAIAQPPEEIQRVSERTGQSKKQIEDIRKSLYKASFQAKILNKIP